MDDHQTDAPSGIGSASQQQSGQNAPGSRRTDAALIALPAVIAGVALVAVLAGLVSLPIFVWWFGIYGAPTQEQMAGPLPTAVPVGVLIAALLTGPGLAILLVTRSRPSRRWMGVGVLVGWVGLGLVSHGWLVGLSPALYDPAKVYKPLVSPFSPLEVNDAAARVERTLNTTIAWAGPNVTGQRPAPDPGLDCREYIQGVGIRYAHDSGTIGHGVFLTVPAGQGQPTLDKLHAELTRNYRPVPDRHEQVTTPDGLTITVHGSGDTTTPSRPTDAIYLGVHTPCLRHMSQLRQ